jgi:hypothetical protein
MGTKRGLSKKMALVIPIGLELFLQVDFRPKINGMGLGDVNLEARHANSWTPLTYKSVAKAQVRLLEQVFHLVNLLADADVQILGDVGINA